VEEGTRTTWLLCGFVKSPNGYHISALDARTALQPMTVLQALTKIHREIFQGFRLLPWVIIPMGIPYRNPRGSCGHTTEPHGVAMGVEGEYLFAMVAVCQKGPIPFNAGDQTKQKTV